MKSLPLLATALLTASSIHAAIIEFDLIGAAGKGLLPGNVPGSVTGGTGGEVGTGILFNDVTLQLTINVGWGSSQGFTDLSSAANNSQIYGATSANSGFNFTQTAGIFSNLSRSSNLPTGGTITQTVNYTAQQAADLMNGKHYISLRTATNPNGEARGFLKPVPEPSSALLAAAGLVGLSSRRWRKA